MRIRVAHGFLALALVLGQQAGAQRAVTIENPAPNPAAPSFRIVPEPVLRIGGLNDDERYELLGVVDAELTSSGGLMVAPNARARVAWATELRVFDAAGKFVRRFGREGQGPGEYQTISRFVVLPRDSVLIYDTRRRITLVDPAGAAVATSPVAATAVCCFTDGGYLTAPTLRPMIRADRQDERPKIPYSLTRVAPEKAPPSRGTPVLAGEVAPGANASAPILMLEGSDPTLNVGPLPSRLGGGGTMFAVPPLPFGRTAFVGLTAHQIVHAIPDAFEYRVYAPDGSLVRTVRAPIPPRPVTKQELDDRLESMMSVYANVPQAKGLFEKVYAVAKFPKTHPAFSAVEVELDGTVWIRSYLPPGAPATDAWWARFDPSGKLLGTLRLPPGTSIIRFTRGHALLSTRDADTETVQVSVHKIEAVRN